MTKYTAQRKTAHNFTLSFHVVTFHSSQFQDKMNLIVVLWLQRQRRLPVRQPNPNPKFGVKEKKLMLRYRAEILILKPSILQWNNFVKFQYYCCHSFTILSSLVEWTLHLKTEFHKLFKQYVSSSKSWL